MEKKPGHFCVVPFVHFSCKPDGRARICCFSQDSYVLDEQGQQSYLGRKPLQEIWHSKWMNSFRNRMLGSTPLKECQFCYNEEAAGKRSKRQTENRKYEAKAQKAIEFAQNHEGRIDSFAPIYFDLRLGNLCNLKCRSCNPLFSSAWAREVENNPDSEAHQGYQDLLDEARRSESWHQNPDFWKQFHDIAETVQEVYLTGGEPMLIKEHFALLRYFIDHGYAAKIHLRYNTNVTVLPAEFLELAPGFKKITLSCSIDALNEKNDWLRSPSKWHIISKNFERILAMPPNVEVDINCTISVFNIFYFDEIVRYFKKISADTGREFEVSADILHQPSFMRMELLPANLKTVAQQKLEQAITIPNLTDLEKDTLKSLVNLLNRTHPRETALRQELSRHINTLDKVRNENFPSAFPELTELSENPK